jgi:tetratricopeptide (TPR) repeat protein
MTHAQPLRIAGALLAALVTVPALAQHREYYLRGRVVDAQQAPLAGAEIELRDKATSRSYELKSDAHGVFKFAGLPHGVYLVTVKREGYATKTDEWKFEASQERMQTVDVPDLVLVSERRVREVQELKQTEAAVKDAAERLKRGEIDSAIAGLQAVIVKRPDDANALFLMGVGHARQQKYREAEASLARVTELAPGFASAWLELGVCRRKLGETEAALAAYEKALSLDAQNADAAYNAGLILFEANRIDEALSRFEQGLAQKPADPDLLDMAARCYLHRQQFDRALVLLERARAATTDPAKSALLDDLVRSIRPKAP